MYSVKCNDIDPNMQCSINFEATGETKDEVRAALMEHGKMHHGEEMAKMTDDEKKMMMQRIEELLDKPM